MCSSASDVTKRRRTSTDGLWRLVRKASWVARRDALQAHYIMSILDAVGPAQFQVGYINHEHTQFLLHNFILVGCILLRYVYVYLSNIPANVTENILVLLLFSVQLRIYWCYFYSLWIVAIAGIFERYTCYISLRRGKCERKNVWLKEEQYVNNNNIRERWARHNKKNSMVWVRERTIPAERPPLVGEVNANFCR
jgi:hypothetical protein